jgi:hypothetical protein
MMKAGQNGENRWRCVSVGDNKERLRLMSQRYTRSAVWRRGWDSNPRSSYPDSSFRDCPIRPLSHLSVGQKTANNHILIRRFAIATTSPETGVL